MIAAVWAFISTRRWALYAALGVLAALAFFAAYLSIRARWIEHGKSKVQERLNERVEEMRDDARKARHGGGPARRDRLRKRFYRD